VRCAFLVRGGFLVAVLLTAACSGSRGFDLDGSTDDAGDDGSVPPDDATTPETGTKDSGTSDTGTKDSGIVADSGDGFGASRTACINEINKLRATEGHTAYALWETSAIDQCVDQQATYDQNVSSPHYAWIHNVYPTCNGNAQDECLGYGTSPSAIVACLDSMWAEKNQSNCSNCANCNGPTLTQAIINCQSTSTCDFYGQYGGECGHYLNMAADYFSEAACGFSTATGNGGWAVQNFK
jgi:hypothetical protein